ncbi:MAG: uroporphyrinogen-III synthase [Sphingobium sp.]
MRPLVILRPEPGAGRTAERATQMGLTATRCLLFEGRALDWDAPSPDGFDALLITSAQTVRLAGPRLALYRALPAYAVGRATAAAMEAAGFGRVIAGETDGTAIAARIAADGHRSVFLPGGVDTAPIEPGPLTLHRTAVYEMIEMEVGALDGLIGQGAVLMVHSPRAGRRLAALVPPGRRGNLHVVAISAAAQAACGARWASIQAAENPDDDRMLALARRLCE